MIDKIKGHFENNEQQHGYGTLWRDLLEALSWGTGTRLSVKKEDGNLRHCWRSVKLIDRWLP
jgi:hypothetical protein